MMFDQQDPLQQQHDTQHPSELETIALTFQQKIKDQNLIQDRKYKLRTYPQCFLGSDAVTCLQQVLQERQPQQQPTVSREHALQVGRRINEEFQLFQHVTNDHLLKDQPLFFKFANNLPSQVRAARQLYKTSWEIVALLEDHFDVQDRTYHFRTYPKCFIGQDAVTVVMNLHLTISRSEAVALVQQVNQECNALEHVTRDHDFQDAYYFYRFIPAKQRMLNPNNQGQTFQVMWDAMVHGGSEDASFSSSLDYYNRGDNDFSEGSEFSDDLVTISSPPMAVVDATILLSVLPPNTTLQDVAQALERDLVVKDHRYRFTVYKSCFIAKDAVTYMVQAGLASSRSRAEWIGRQLQTQLNLFHHVTNDHKFRDKYYFFRFTPLEERTNLPPTTTTTPPTTALPQSRVDGAATTEPPVPQRRSLGHRMPSSKQAIMADLKESHMSLEDIAIAIERGMKVHEQVYKLKTYPNSFTGPQLVKFLVKKGFCNGRADAVLLGRLVADEFQLFEHVGGGVMAEKELVDCPLTLYQFVPREERKARLEVRQQLQSEHLHFQTQQQQQQQQQDGAPQQSAQLESQPAALLDPELLEVAALFRQGVKIKHHKYRGKVYPNTFIGSQAVDFLVNSSLAESRKEAVKLGRRIMNELHSFDHVTGDHDFADDYKFYQFEEDRRELQNQSGGVRVSQSFFRSSTVFMSKIGPKEVSSVINTPNQSEDFSFATDFLPLEKIARDFRKSVQVKDRRYRFSVFKDVFVGSEAVDYLVGKTSWASSRQEAVNLGQTLMRELDLFHHVTKSHTFRDDELFYSFTDEDEETMLNRLESLGEDKQQPFLDTSSSMAPSHLVKIARALEENLHPKDNQYRLRVYKNTLVGSEILTFLVKSNLASTRAEALMLGRAVAKHFQLFEHVTLDHLLKDSNLFYRFVPAANRVNGKWFMNTYGGRLRDKMLRVARKRKSLSVGEYWDLVVDAIENDSWDIRVSALDRPIQRFTIVSDDTEWASRVKSFERQVFLKSFQKMRMSTFPPTPSGRLLENGNRAKCWSSTFIRLDPRQQIHRFYNEVAQTGASECPIEDADSRESIRAITIEHLRPLLRFLPINLASVFTVWRPTSFDAIRKMMTGEAVGKGLDIKGKSAKRGKLSGYVPFLQINDNKHKSKVRRLSPKNMVRIFYKADGRRARDVAAAELEKVLMEMMEMVKEATKVLGSDKADKQMHNNALECMLLDVETPSITPIDDYAPLCYGIEIPERLFWEAYFVRQDCTRKGGSIYDSGRPSQPAFQDMNFAALRAEPHEGAPKAVVYQNADRDDPLNPFELLMAYEEKGRVLPVVSDFDCFLVGTRRVHYTNPLPQDQLEVLKWCVNQIESIVEKMLADKMQGKKEKKPWSLLWLEVLKESSFHPEIPRFGFGDPISYSIVENAVERLHISGAVRHGAECFNYYFPQDLDEEFLFVGESIHSIVPWKYVGVDELQDILAAKIEEGFCFPLNPKWILMDEGWMQLYQKLLHSKHKHVQEAMNVWFPPESGLREQFERIYSLQKKLKRLERKSDYILKIPEEQKQEIFYFT